MTVPGDRRVVVIGGGLAGLAAASVLSSRGFGVTLLESRPRLGGRASSIVDRETGESIDNCQHVAMGCCTCFQDFCRRTGCAHLFETQKRLHFVGPPERPGNEPSLEAASEAPGATSATVAPPPPTAVTPPESTDSSPPIVDFAASPLPAPLHLASSLLRMPWFSFREKRVIATGLRQLARDTSGEDCAFKNWLDRHRQPESVQRRFWHLVLVSALSESLDRISFLHARKVFVDGFLSNRHGWEVSVPTVPLDDIYETAIATKLRDSGVDIRIRSGVRSLHFNHGKTVAAELRDGSKVEGDEFVLAVPHWLVGNLLPEGSPARSVPSSIDQLQTAPIASVHLWYDQPITALPHATFVDRLSQWMFKRSRLNPGGSGHRHEHRPLNQEKPPDSDRSGSAGQPPFRFQVVISAARDLSSLSEADVLAQVDSELKEVWPESRDARLIHGRMITEHRAVFSPLPDVDRLRPVQQSPVPNLQLAGDWTATGWPSTMEGAVRSGYLAAANIVERAGRIPEPLPDGLPTSRLYRWLF